VRVRRGDQGKKRQERGKSGRENDWKETRRRGSKKEGEVG
jgi:hypothetical protein